jgi:dipeptidyl aminopeptidase/acylaminoacyl peptidase
MSPRSTRFPALVTLVAMAAVTACGGSRTTPASEPTSSMPVTTSASSEPSPPISSSQSSAPIRGRLFFTRTTGADVQTVFVASGGHERQLTQPGEVCCILRVAPKGGRILVMPGGEIEPPITGGTVNMSGADFSRLALTDPTLNLVPGAWSPDGSRIAFEGWDDADPDRTGIYTAHASDGSDPTRVTTRPGNFHDVPLDFSPDGKQLVFYRSVHADPDPHTGGSLWVVNADGSGAHQITTEASKPADWARWSPEGTRILFGSERLSASGPLWTVSPSGSNLAKLFEDPNGGFALAPDWSPDGSQVAFALGLSHDEFEHQPNAIYTIARDGSGLQLVNGSDDFKRQLEWVR